ncbi:hypothetical protein PF008_g28875 [Phytophthora fragariae]|uniref:Uncharacterized protein n=1 Tax=Phytophthora fragariae TaxID=53985 RepID=A0A6G0QA14_9STRA|nr:hypothetical protein PF008_g28875 [Phytophthora fragariae]
MQHERPLHEQQRVLAKLRLQSRAGDVEQPLHQLFRVALGLRSAAVQAAHGLVVGLHLRIAELEMPCVQCSSTVDAAADEFQRAQEAVSSWRRAATVRVGAESAPAEMSASAEKSVPARSLTTDVARGCVAARGATGAWRRGGRRGRGGEGALGGRGAPRGRGGWRLVIVRKIDLEIL